jgi:hypothetical protein
MLRRLHAQITLALPLVFVLACGGSQKKAEVPDFTEKGWSGPSGDSPTVAKADPPIQSTTPKGDDATAMKADPPPAPASKPETSGGAESDVVSGNALPPSPNATKAPAKPNKAKKTKTKKKKQQS